MGSDGQGWLDRAVQARGLRRWTRLARAAQDTDLPDLRAQRTMARRLKARLDELIHVADARLALPQVGNQSFPRPQESDWGWRPEVWSGPLPVQGLVEVRSNTGLGREATLFHDCPRAEMALRQVRNLREADLAAFGLQLDVFDFRGSYLSLAVDLPAAAIEGLTRQHLVRLDATVEMEQPLEIFARLNVRHGPNTEQVVRELPLQKDTVFVEFDLAYTRLNEKRVDKMWLDLIFESPRMNRIMLRDLTFSRRRRAAL